MDETRALDSFHPAVRRWFLESFGTPTPAQALGWPPIARGEHTLILAPTGSGKTLAAFLFALSDLFVRIEAGNAAPIHTLYLSPLKALASDIERNLENPLEGIRRAAEAIGSSLPQVLVGVRTGDTSPAERERMRRRPPHILITTPESLHLLLLSPRSKEALRGVRYVIVDEIHALCENKRGTFLTLLLERLEELTSTPFLRIGLSATQRPLERVAEFLGGYGPRGTARPVTQVDAGLRKDLDLQVVSPVKDMAHLPVAEDGSLSVWPAIYDRLLELVEAHRSTLIFANNRAAVERIASELNRRAGYPLVRAHHASVSKEKRQEIEQDLKAGRLPGLVATASLELGIDMGAIDLVCQVESPHSVAHALQRVGRAGHLYRAASKGRLIPKTRADLLELAALAQAMKEGWTSAVHVPKGPLDVLAQQVVAAVAVRERRVDDLFALVRRAAPYHDLSEEAFLSVLDLVAGGRGRPLAAAKARVSWDRASGMLYPLPGSRQLAVANGGAIPDTGQYPVVLADGVTRLGELDEEFVYERREGQTILLGTSRWRILEIESDRVVVAPSQEAVVQPPFWKGEGLGRDVEFGRRVGAFSRECERRLREPGFEAWLQSACALDSAAARSLRAYLEEGLAAAGVLPSDRVVLLDAFPDDLGQTRLAIVTPFGRAFHFALLLACLATFRRARGPVPLASHSDGGILFDLGGLSLDDAVRAIQGIRSCEAADLVAQELQGSAFFGTRFRQSAARALLLPRLRPGRRTPLWLQRLRARDLLELARREPSFPIVVEAFRESLQDLLPVEDLVAFLEEVSSGEARFHLRRGSRPSPFTSPLVFDFTAVYTYEYDLPKAVAEESRVERDAVRGLLAGAGGESLFDADAVAAVEERLQALSPVERARDGVELVETVRRLGDLSEDELRRRSEPAALDALPRLLEDGRLARIHLAGATDPDRIVVGEPPAEYVRQSEEDRAALVRRALSVHAAATPEGLARRYGLPSEAVRRLLSEMELVPIPTLSGQSGYALPEVAAGIRRLTLSRRRRSVRQASAAAYAQLLVSLQHVASPGVGTDGLESVLRQLRWLYLPLELWARVLASRVRDYRGELLDRLLLSGRFVWRGLGHEDGPQRIAFCPRETLPSFLRLSPPSEHPEREGLPGQVRADLLGRGASFLGEIAARLGRAPSDVATALWDLLWAGEVTNDCAALLRAGRPRPELWRGARARPGGWAGGAGRFSLLAPPEPAGEATEEDAGQAVEVLLDRRAVVCRETLALESWRAAWPRLYALLTRLEWQGAVDRGLFVSHLSGSQFARPEAIAGLSAPEAATSLTLLAAADPANPYGTAALFPLSSASGASLPFRRQPGNYVVLRGGTPVLAVEARGERLSSLVDLGPEERRRVIGVLGEIQEREPRRGPLRVLTWDGRPAASSVAAADLQAVGFQQEGEALFRYRSFEPRPD